jgi:hypothetical protein
VEVVVERMGKILVSLVAGFAAGVAFIVACGESPPGGGAGTNLGPGNAAAQAGCTQYDVQIFDTSGMSNQIDTLPPGWIPFTIAAATASVVAFRCTP